ncbi:50S ribosomal protein L6 [Porphyromonas somerae]|uniref:Large ribosomal subunit protein uL6 n=1 Tax=Porphyromonas somerae TaxID=322095 RepID=A0A134B6G0_9PORP|nr:50S ribosomal protein L6 [Porphyromonas somerae]KXB74097.1 ribosomal protein L6 [Porphyromonadaceae bacterium KA00676]KXB75516.1 ribosomal protein L6 [Porphyromonas somerae]
MSRIGKHPISIPAGVTVSVKDGVVTVKGPKGELTQSVDARIEVAVEDAQVVVRRNSDERQERSLHGLYRALINNMVVGVSEGFTKTLELVGVGYRASNQGQILELSLGFTHNIFLQLPKEINLETKTERNKNPLIILSSADKQLLGQVCSKIRSFRMPEPYKGKGIRFEGEVVRRKSGKSAGK